MRINESLAPMGQCVPHRVTLVTGGASSGKSAFAETLALLANPAPHYLASARAGDGEMAARIVRHAARRGPTWTLVEEPGDLAARLPGLGARAILLDCATIWLANRLSDGLDAAGETARLVAALGRAGCPVVVVTNELGQGIVPADAATRAFREAHGAMNQALAAAADRVVMVVSGLPMELK